MSDEDEWEMVVEAGEDADASTTEGPAVEPITANGDRAVGKRRVGTPVVGELHPSDVDWNEDDADTTEPPRRARTLPRTSDTTKKGTPHPKAEAKPVAPQAPPRQRSVIRTDIAPAVPKELPHETAFEAAILGGVLIRSDLLGQLDLDVDAFYDHRHKVVFQAMHRLVDRAQPIDPVTLESEIAKTGKLDAIGGVAYLGELANECPTTENVIWYANEVRRLHGRRRFIETASAVVERGYHSEDPDFET
jgi:hypothetical protein